VYGAIRARTGRGHPRSDWKGAFRSLASKRRNMSFATKATLGTIGIAAILVVGQLLMVAL